MTTNNTGCPIPQGMTIDVNDEKKNPLIGKLKVPISIDELSPAGEALRASAMVRVTRLRKFARSLHVDLLHRKESPLGNNKGKPPRIEELKPLEDKVEESGEEATNVDTPGEASGKVEKKQKKQKKAKKGKHAKGKVILKDHELYVLSISMMLGLNTALHYTDIKLKKDLKKNKYLEADDFNTTQKYTFPPKGGTYYGIETPPHQIGHTFKFKDYSPLSFAYIRRLFGVNESQYLNSICGNTNFIEFISNAKSGQFFFYSFDGKYMIKTMTNAESKFLRDILPAYFSHCAVNPNTLLPRFFGMYRVKLYHLNRTIKFIVMNSIFDTNKAIQKFYDLKGSVIGRDAPGQTVMKDNDLRKEFPDSKLHLSDKVQNPLRKQVISDCNFLSGMGIMDYSMLVGVSHLPSKTDLRMNLNNIGGISFRNLDLVTDLKQRNLIPQSGEDSGQRKRTMPSAEMNKKIEVIQESQIADNMGVEALDKDSELDRNVEDIADNTEEEVFNENSGLDTDLEDKQPDDSMENKTNEGRSVTSDVSKDNEEKSYIDLNECEFGLQVLFDETNTNHHAGYEAVQKLISDVNGKENANLPEYFTPISNRVDRGLEMDKSNTNIPMKYATPDGKVQNIDGKIFYIGIIDVLQEFNARKYLEATYRRMKGGGWEGASCVNPQIYADRFIRFFDEYTDSNTPSSD
eukprot:CAMPEP_0184866398 /NCGR_PEP_ID=MMETSP0580-20130426/22194_1 /TAXON_ID=1118495 /ORGANISM="Dactyliosolen fragilissimus" /LENGTH=685 /DNA_ID=CAMNT_0027366079 /DNA_START=17 /DNA_END=2074 /DNA_ORIENTATION=+